MNPAGTWEGNMVIFVRRVFTLISSPLGLKVNVPELLHITTYRLHYHLADFRCIFVCFTSSVSPPVSQLNTNLP